MTDDPKRLLDEGPKELRTLLDAGRAEIPTERQMAALALKLGALVGGGAAGGGAAAAAGTAKAAAGGAKVVASAAATKTLAAGVAAKITAVAVVATVAASGTAYVVHERSVAPRPTSVGLVATTPTPTPTPIPVPTPTPIPTPTPDPIATVAKTSAAPADPADDFGLVDRAQKAGSPARALELCNEHARKFPNGGFAQEREVIAIDALVKLGRRDDAEARAKRFAAKYPGSAQSRRIDAILGR
jgi:hypothetical protein